MVRALVLNASYEPLSVVSERRALVLVLTDKARVVVTKDETWHSESLSIEIPSVVRLTRYVKVPYRRSVPVTRRAVFGRDGHQCQYCGGPAESLDHVTPKSRGGDHTWENVVTACVRCNHRKAGRTPAEAGMQLLRQPAAPRANPYYHLMHRQLPDEWSLYLPWKQPSRRSAALA